MKELKLWQERYFVWNKELKRYTPRARAVMEKYLGRRLKTDECVHHINKIKTDDRRENLEIKQRGTHTREHLKLYHTVEEQREAWRKNALKSYRKNIDRVKKYEKSPRGRERYNRWLSKNKEKEKIRKKKYYDEHKEEIIEKQREKRRLKKIGSTSDKS